MFEEQQDKQSEVTADQENFISAAFSGEMDIEDLEFLSNQQAEMIAGGLGFASNTMVVNGMPSQPNSFNLETYAFVLGAGFIFRR